MFHVLSLIFALKPQFIKFSYIEHVNGRRSQTNKDQKSNLLFYNDMINIKDFELNLLKIYKKHYPDINIYYIGYITIENIGDCESIYSVNSLYLLINHTSRYIEEKMEINIWFLILQMKTKKRYKKYADVWNGTKNKIKAINDSECNSVEENDYEKDSMKIKFWWWLAIKQTAKISCNDHNYQICFRRR